VKILLERDDLIAVDKPAGLPVIPGRDGGPNLRDQLKRKVWVVHRLDRDTSGVVLFALNAETHRTLSMAFEAGEVKKTYLALVEGLVDAPLDLQFPLAEARRSRMKVAENGKAARTLIRPHEKFPTANASLVEAEPLTGRTHQIRVHLAHAGHPLLFDHQYRHGGQRDEIERTPLHAWRIEWRDVKVECPLPEDFEAALRKLRQS
jgi:RluA family pseudouridine synthase